MHPLDAREMLLVWERGRRQHPVDRALTLIAAACPGTTRADAARWPVGWCDAALLTMHQATFGGELRGVADCPACGGAVEIAVLAGDLLLRDSAASTSADGWFDVHDLRVHFRAADSTDLAAAWRAGDMGSARRVIAARCTLEAFRGSETVPADALDDGELEHLAAAMAALDPQAELTLAVTCPECAHRWSERLDVLQFCWSDVSTAARRLFGEVNALARAYGWSEREILELPSARRQSYLELLAT